MATATEKKNQFFIDPKGIMVGLVFLALAIVLMSDKKKVSDTLRFFGLKPPCNETEDPGCLLASKDCSFKGIAGKVITNPPMFKYSEVSHWQHSLTKCLNECVENHPGCQTVTWRRDPDNFNHECKMFNEVGTFYQLPVSSAQYKYTT
eukprot:gene1105-2149_t